MKNKEMIIVLTLSVWEHLFHIKVSISKMGQNWFKQNAIDFCFPLKDFSEPSYANEDVHFQDWHLVCSIFQFFFPRNHFYNYPKGITLENSGLK